MDDFAIEMRVTGTKQIRSILKRAINRTNDLRSFFHGKLLPYLQGIHENRFITHTGPNNEQWASLTEGYLATKRKRESPFPGAENILMRTGEMVSALAESNQYSIRSVGKNVLEYGLAGFRDNRHIVSQFGTKGAMTMGFSDAQQGVPARPFFGLSEAQMNSVDDQLMDYIEEAFRSGAKNTP